MNAMRELDLKKRTKAFALRILKLVDVIPKTTAGRALASQIVRSGTAVAANYRAAPRAKSTAHFLSKLGDVEEEADETLFWLEMLEESELVTAGKLVALKQEADELVAIVVTSINTARRNDGAKPRRSDTKSSIVESALEAARSDFRLPTSDFE